MLILRCAVLTLITSLFASAAFAWGPLGHELVGTLAQQQLSPAAQREVVRLLAPEHVDSLAAIASWPDQIQNDPAQAALWQRTRSQHYINFRNAGCDYVPPLDCRNGQCVVGGLQEQMAVLGDRTRSDADRRQALKFVVHFVGDVHQPLHAGYRPDKGGNTWQVQFDGRGSNLHRVWDSGMLSRRGLDAPAYERLLEARGPVALPAPIAPPDNAYAQWARESCLITAQPGFYPERHQISQAYVDAQLPVAELRIRQAARRLAQLLNLPLVPATRTVPTRQ